MHTLTGTAYSLYRVYLSVLKLVMIKKCNNCDHLGLEIKILPIFRPYQKNIPTICLMLHQLNLYVLLVCGKIVMVEIFLLNVSGESKCMTKWQFIKYVGKSFVSWRLRGSLSNFF